MTPLRSLRRRALALLAAGVVIAGPLAAIAPWSGTPVASATDTPTTLYVNANASGDDVCTQTSPCETIQDAIDIAEGSLADDSVTIEVAAGYYDESDTIEKPTNPSITIDGGGSSTTALNDGGTGTDLTIDGGNVKVSGLIIEGGIGTSLASAGGLSISGAIVTLDDDAISNDSSNVIGVTRAGGVFATGSDLTMVDDTLADDSATGSGIGGVYATLGELSISGTTFTADVGTHGGAVSSTFNTSATLSSDTFVNNTSTNGSGALEDENGPMTITNDTFVDDTSSNGSGAISSGTNIVYANSIFLGSGCVSNGGTLTDGGDNVMDSSSGSCSHSASDQETLVAADLGSLAYNGGPTQTVALSGTSASDPAIGAVSGSLVPCPTIDQRAAPRPSASCDAGAFQTGSSGYAATLTLTAPSASLAPGSTASISATLVINGVPAPAGLTVSLAVQSGPDTGQTLNAATSMGGIATFSETNDGTAGTDQLQASSAVGAGSVQPSAITSPTADVYFDGVGACDTPITTGTDSFEVTCPVGSSDIWTVPNGVMTATFDVEGAQGGGANGGAGWGEWRRATGHFGCDGGADI